MNYFQVAARRMSISPMPSYLIVFVTNRCMAGCEHCFYWKNLNKGKDIELGMAENIAKTCGKLFHVNLTGGEPFLNKDLPLIASMFYRYAGVRSFGIPTTGFNKKIIIKSCNEILKLCPGSKVEISISFDNIGEKHDVSRKIPGLYKEALTTLSELKKIAVLVTVNLLLTNENQKDIENIYSELNKYARGAIYPILIRSEPKTRRLLNVDISKYQSLIALANEDSIIKKKSVSEALITAKEVLTRRLILDYIKGKDYPYTCVAGKHGGVIYESGEVYPCELLKTSFGNMHKCKNLEEIWHSKKADRIREKIKKEKCSCTHECFQGLNVAFNSSTSVELGKTFLSVLKR